VDDVADRDAVCKAQLTAVSTQPINSSVLGSVFTRYKTPAFVNLDFSPAAKTFVFVPYFNPFPVGRSQATSPGYDTA
jgi:hypothetical protein